MRRWGGLAGGLLLLLAMEGTAHASGQGAVVFVLMVLPALVAFFFGFLGFGLLLVEKQHRGLFIGMYLGCMIAAHFLSKWIPGFAALLVAFLPILFALHDRGGWKALVAAAVAVPLALWGYRQLVLVTVNESIWYMPLVASIPLLPFVVACWVAEKRRLALASLPLFVACSYLFMLTTIARLK